MVKGKKEVTFSHPGSSYIICSKYSPQNDFAEMQEFLVLTDHQGQLQESVRDITCQDNGTYAKLTILEVHQCRFKYTY
jgi:hypothetical protein